MIVSTAVLRYTNGDLDVNDLDWPLSVATDKGVRAFMDSSKIYATRPQAAWVSADQLMVVTPCDLREHRQYESARDQPCHGRP
jgi:hypothetical protein